MQWFVLSLFPSVCVLVCDYFFPPTHTVSEEVDMHFHEPQSNKQKSLLAFPLYKRAIPPALRCLHTLQYMFSFVEMICYYSL